MFQGKRHISYVDEVEPNHQEVIDGVCQVLIPEETVDEENPSVFVQGAGDPDRLSAY